MVPLIMTAAFGAAKLNELQFLHLQNQWKELRSCDAACCSINLSWYIQRMADHRAYGRDSSDRDVLVKRFCTLQSERNSCMQKIIALQGQLPFTRFPLQTIAKAKECWSLRSRFQELNRTIDSALYRGQLPQLAGQLEPLPTQTRSKTCNLTFLANSTTSWSLAHTSDFRFRYYQNCISYLEKPQLDALRAQLQFLHKESVEQVWGELIKRSERLMIAMAILQSGFLGSIRLGLGSILAASCSKQMQAQEIAKFFFISSRIFGIASLVTAIAIGFAVRSQGNLMRENRERMEAINRVKKLMESAIRTMGDRRFEEIAQAGLSILMRQEKRLAKMGRRIALEGQQIQKREESIQNLQDKSAEKGRYLQDQVRELNEQKKTIAAQRDALNEQKDMITSQHLDMGERKCKLEDQKSKLEDQKSQLEDQKSQLEDHESKLEDHESKLEDQKSKLEDQKSQLGDHESKLEDHESKLEDQKSQLEDQKSQLEDHESRLATIDKAIVNLIDKFKTLENLSIAKAS